jgi:hypothetical protein
VNARGARELGLLLDNIEEWVTGVGAGVGDGGVAHGVVDGVVDGNCGGVRSHGIVVRVRQILPRVEHRARPIVRSARPSRCCAVGCVPPRDAFLRGVGRISLCEGNSADALQIQSVHGI